jgi:NADH-ubiquinone oxidoreductase chain 6
MVKSPKSFKRKLTNLSLIPKTSILFKLPLDIKTLLIFTLILTIFTFIFTQLTHPLAIGLLLVIHTTTTAILITLIIDSPWFSYILFLVFLGGILVLFIYVTSLASNEIFSFKKVSTSLIPIFLLPRIIILLIDPLLYIIPISTQDTLNHRKEFQEMLAIKFYNESIIIITLALAVYLFIALVAVVKITNLCQGPLRPAKTYVNTHSN